MVVRTRPLPIALAGARERIDQIVGSSIQEPPDTQIIELPLGSDPARGYIVVVVPRSARAPHQVVVKDNYRFYGRGATGNRMLGQAEVDALYARRHRWDVDRDDLL